MRDTIEMMLIAVLVFVCGIILIFLPPSNSFWTILGIFGLIFSLCLLIIAINEVIK